MSTIKCSVCAVEKSEDRFSRAKNTKSGRRGQCKDCHNTYVREVWYVKNRQKQKDSSAKWRIENRAKVLATKYGSTESIIQELLDRGSCDVCGDTEAPLCVDHCHDTGEVRGVLCQDCNIGIGRMKDDVDRLRSAAVYLENRERSDGQKIPS